LRPKTYSVLIYLLENAGRLVSKAELMGIVWGGRSVEEGVLNQSISEIRQALGDDRKHPKFIQTISRKGYRFIAAIGARPARRV
jgi:DNA-binding winged helix-turn-helix (wHTH) protein